jgi:hypothetical protein
MSLPIDIATYNTYGNISSFLAMDDFSSRNQLNGSSFNSDLPMRLSLVTRIVQWNYNRDPNDTTLVNTGNYLYSLCGRYIQEAKTILGTGGSGIIINPATGLISTIVAQNIEFTIGQPGSLMNVGDTTLVLNYTFVMGASVIISIDGADIPIGTYADRIACNVIYTSNNITLTFNQAVVNNQVYSVKFLQYVTI